MVIIKFTVRGQLLKLNTDLRRFKVTSDTLNHFKCQFNFDSSWDGFEKRVYFKNASYNITKPAILDDAGYCYIPWEVLAHTGVILCNVTGIKYVDGNAVRLTAGPIKMFAHNSEEGTFKPEYEHTPTPSEFEQYIAKVRIYADDALSAKSEAISAKVDAILAKEAAESAEHKIAHMTATAETGEAGTEASVTRTDYDDYFNLHFTVPKGDKGDTGDTGDTGHSPVVTASKVGKITTVYVDGVAIATINDGEDGSLSPDFTGATSGSAGVHGLVPAPEIGKTSYLLCSDGTWRLLRFYCGAEDNIVDSITFDNTGKMTFNFKLAATNRNGLMSKTDKTKLDGIASGAEVNVQSDWNEADSSDNAYIKNKPSIHNVPSGGTSGQVLAKSSGTDYDVEWIAQSGGASAFIAEYGVTTYADVKDAYDEDAIIICTVDDSGNTVICHLAYYDDANGIFYFAQPQSDGFYLAFIGSDDTWDDSYFTFASTDTATDLRDGLMSALDYQKLDGIASGAEVNVQSDWNEADSTADAYIKNKPTIKDEIYWAVVNTTTYTQLDSAVANGKTVCVYYNDKLYTLTYRNGYKFYFSSLAYDGTDYKFYYIVARQNAGTQTLWTMSLGVNIRNVQSDWNEADSTADDYIKNKPTIPTKTSDLNNDSGFITGIQSLLKVEEYTLTHSVSAGSSAQSTKAITKAGYYPIGVVGYDIAGSASTWLAPFKLGLTDVASGSATIYANLRNYSTGNSSGNMTVKVLWVKE